MQKIKTDIKNTFDTVAKEYDGNKHFLISAKKMADLINFEREDVNILDLSTGTGNVAIELALKFPKAKIYGIDISDEMLKIAQAKTKELGVDNIAYLLQDAENIDFQGIRFDLVTCGYGLFFFPNMEKVVSDVFESLKDGGKFVFSTFTQQAFQPHSKIFLDMLEQNYNIAPPKRIEERQLATKEEITKLLGLVRHDALNIHNIEIIFPMQISEWWRLLNSTGYKGLISQLGSNFERFESEYLGYLQSCAKDGYIEFNANSLICAVGKK